MRRSLYRALCLSPAMLLLLVAAPAIGTPDPGGSTTGARQGREAKSSSRTWEGKISGTRGSFALTARVKRHRKPVELTAIRYRGLPASCTVSPPPVTIRGRFDFRAVHVHGDRTFRGKGRSGGSSFFVEGRFGPDLRRVEGRIQVTTHFPPENPPEETCTSKRRRYAAKR